MAKKNFPIQMTLEAVDRFSAPFRKFSNTLGGVEKSLSKVSNRFSLLGRETGITRIATSAVQLGSGLRNATREASALGAKLAAVGIAGAWLFKREFIDTAAQFERYGVMLETIEGSAEKAGEALNYITEFTARTPYEIQNVTDAYVKLRNFGLDPTDGSLQAIADTTSMLGGEAEKLDGIILALGQAWTKQKLQGEEALQLLERGVPVWDLLSKATGKTTAELQKLSAAGKLGQDAIQVLIRAMGERAAGASDKFSKTFSGMVSNLMDRWTQFKVAVMDSGPFTGLKERLAGLLETISRMAANGELQALAERTGAAIVEFMQKAAVFGKQAWEVLKIVASAFQWIHDLFGSWKPLLYGFIAILAGPLVAALYGVATALGAVGIAFGLTPFGAAIAAVGVLTAAVSGLVAWYRKLSGAAQDADSATAGGNEQVPSRPNPRIVDLVSRQAELNDFSMQGGVQNITENRLIVEIPSLPAGGRATIVGNNKTPISLDVGYSMGTP